MKQGIVEFTTKHPHDGCSDNNKHIVMATTEEHSI